MREVYTRLSGSQHLTRDGPLSHDSLKTKIKTKSKEKYFLIH